jgi:hypothetical protein
VTARTGEVGGADAWAPTSSKRERERRRAGARGPSQGKEKWVGPRRNSEIFDLFK